MVQVTVAPKHGTLPNGFEEEKHGAQTIQKSRTWHHVFVADHDNASNAAKLRRQNIEYYLVKKQIMCAAILDISRIAFLQHLQDRHTSEGGSKACWGDATSCVSGTYHLRITTAVDGC